MLDDIGSNQIHQSDTGCTQAVQHEAVVVYSSTEHGPANRYADKYAQASHSSRSSSSISDILVYAPVHLLLLPSLLSLTYPYSRGYVQHQYNNMYNTMLTPGHVNTERYDCIPGT